MTDEAKTEIETLARLFADAYDAAEYAESEEKGFAADRLVEKYSVDLGLAMKRHGVNVTYHDGRMIHIDCDANGYTIASFLPSA